MTQVEYSVIRVGCVIEKVLMGIKFPCQISFLLKNQHKNVEGIKQYELIDGSCQPKEKITIDQDIQMKGSSFADAKATLILVMISANGKIPAGSVCIHITQSGQINCFSEVQMPIEKCPDRGATIFVSVSSQLIRSFRKPVIGLNLSQKVLPQLSISRINSTYGHERDKKIYYSPRNDASYGSKKFETPRRFEPRYGRERHHSKRASFLSKEDSLSNSQISENEMLDEIRREESQVQQKNIYRLQKQKSDYMKEITKLKGEIYNIRRQQQWHSEEQINKYKSEMDSLSSQLDSFKEKYRQSERRNREFTHTIKNLQEQVEKMTSKYNNCEIIKNQQSYCLDEKQKKMKDYQIQMKKLKQQIDDSKINLSMQEKKIEFKQNTYKDQIKKLNQKYQLSEQERQKSVLELNNFLSELQKNQKKHQLVLKQKQRAFLEQKNILVKKYEQQNRKFQKLEDEKEDLIMKKKDLDQVIKNHISRQKDLIQELSKQKKTSEQLNSQIHKKYMVQKNLEKEIEDLKSTKQELVAIKKKYGQIMGEFDRARDNLERQIKIKKKTEQKLSQISELYRELGNEKSLISAKLLQATKNIQSLRKSEQNLQRQIQSLNEELGNANHRNIELKEKIENERHRNQEENHSLGQQIAYYIKSKQYLENQVEEARWKIDKYEENYQTIRIKNNEANDEILRLNGEQLTLQEANKKTIQKNKQLVSEVQSLKKQKAHLEKKDKQNSIQLKEKVQNIYNLNKMIKEKEQTIYMNNQKSKQRQHHYEERIQELENALTLKSNIYGEKTSKLKELQIELSQKERLLNKLQQTSKYKNQEVKFYEQNTKTYQQQLVNSEKEKDDLKQVQKQLQITIKKLQKDIEIKKEEIIKNETKYQNLLNQWEQYRKETFQALTVLIKELGKNFQSQHESVLHSFPDESLCNLQIQSIKSKKMTINKYNEKITQLQEMKIMLQLELQKIKTNSQERQNEIENLLNKQKQKMRNFHKQISTQKNQSSTKIITLEENIINLKAQNEKLSLEILKQKQILEQQEEEVNKAMMEIELLNSRIAGMEKNIQTNKVEGEKSKVLKTNEYNFLIEEKKAVIDQYQQNAKELQKKINNLEAFLLEKQATIRKYQSDLSSFKYANQKLEQKLEFADDKFRELGKKNLNTEKQLKSQERMVRDKNNSEETLRAELATQKYRSEEFQLRNKKLQNELDDSLSQMEKLKKQVIFLTQNLNEVNHEKKKMQEKSKNQLEKIKSQQKESLQKIIHLNSEMELKAFIIQQHQNNLKNYKSQITELQQDLREKKLDIIQKQKQIEQLKNELMFMHQNMSNLNFDKNVVEAQLMKCRQKIEQFERDIEQYQKIIDDYNLREQKSQIFRDQQQDKQLNASVIVNGLEERVFQLTSQSEEKKIRENELIEKIQSLQQQLARSRVDSSQEQEVQKIQLLEELSRIEGECDELRFANSKLQEEINALRENSQEDLNINHVQVSELIKQVAERDEKLRKKQKVILQCEQKIGNLQIELKKCLQAWNNEKQAIKESSQKMESNKYQRFMSEIDSRSKKLSQRSRKDINPNQK